MKEDLIKMYGDDWAMITLKKKVKNYKEIVEKLLKNEVLSDDEKKFLDKEGVGDE